ncbi:tRNA1(Val) (adenine(37)-N6)-methyltransferase [Chakrabartyella piscis]|uniref:tRNA1(Val) (adenine(37)-N6)-methyltransferase n=1 Tax=Chakrabartyella piscis TaxID=2918914 RepID=UPI0029589E9C|nr:tRNA1(Val) (adenine(37)-N6)-methyltransferase [Chakrabartyella piscis]
MINKFTLNEGERLDDLHRNGYHVIQNPKSFCFGIDAVLLSDFARVKKGETVLDLGTGTGIVPILMEAKTDGFHFTGLEIQAESVDMAQRSVIGNGLSEKISIVHGDIKEIPTLFPQTTFDVVTTNPPYMNAGFVGETSAKSIARHEILCTLEDIIAGASRVLGTKGRFYMIHRPNRLTDIITMMRKHKLEPKTLRFVQPFVDKEPTMVLIEGAKDGSAWVNVLPPLIVYESVGKHTDEILQIYDRER